MVSNFVMIVDQGHTKFGPHRLNSEQVMAVQSLKTCHYTQVYDLAKIGVYLFCALFVYQILVTKNCGIVCVYSNHAKNYT